MCRLRTSRLGRAVECRVETPRTCERGPTRRSESSVEPRGMPRRVPMRRRAARRVVAVSSQPASSATGCVCLSLVGCEETADPSAHVCQKGKRNGIVVPAVAN